MISVPQMVTQIGEAGHDRDLAGSAPACAISNRAFQENSDIALWNTQFGMRVMLLCKSNEEACKFRWNGWGVHVHLLGQGLGCARAARVHRPRLLPSTFFA